MLLGELPPYVFPETLCARSNRTDARRQCCGSIKLQPS